MEKGVWRCLAGVCGLEGLWKIGEVNGEGVKDKFEQESDLRETKSGEHHGSEVCVEPNDAKQQLTQIVFDLGVFVFEFWVLHFRDK